jgi:hypothetical protein
VGCGSDKSIDYFTKLLEDDLKAVVKPQYVDQIPKAIRAADKSVKALIESRLSMDNLDQVVDTLGESTLLPLSHGHANAVQSCATSMTVMFLTFPVENSSALPSEQYASRRPTCKRRLRSSSTTTC